MDIQFLEYIIIYMLLNLGFILERKFSNFLHYLNLTKGYFNTWLDYSTWKECWYEDVNQSRLHLLYKSQP